MTDYKTDEEKAEELKAWWKENGKYIIAGVALAIIILFGREYWQKREADRANNSSNLYYQLQNAADETAKTSFALTLKDDYASTPYAALAAMDLAKQYAEAGEYDKATAELRWAVDKAKDSELTDVATLRLARVLVAQNQLDEAEKLLNRSLPKAYASLQEEIRGDIYVARQQTDKAQQAYERAIETNQAGATDLIRLKLDNLGKGV